MVVNSLEKLKDISCSCFSDVCILSFQFNDFLFYFVVQFATLFVLVINELLSILTRQITTTGVNLMHKGKKDNHANTLQTTKKNLT